MGWLGRWRRARPNADEMARQERTWADLKAGRLPASARERLDSAAGRHVFTSDVSARELVALRAAGLEPVGQAFGTATFQVSAAAQSYARYAIHPSTSAYGPPSTRTNRAYRYAVPVGPRLLAGYHEGANTARAAALKRLRQECAALGGDGVVGVRIVASSPGQGLHEFTVIGTAVRDRARAGEDRPFTTVLAAVDVGLLRAAGWRPVDMVYEHQRYGGHGGWVSLGGNRMNPLYRTAQELAGASTVTTFAGEQTRQRMQAGPPGGGGMILSSYDVNTDVEECRLVDGHTDFVVDVEAVGTTVTPMQSVRVLAPIRLAVIPVVGLDRR